MQHLESWAAQPAADDIVEWEAADSNSQPTAATGMPGGSNTCTAPAIPESFCDVQRNEFPIIQQFAVADRVATDELPAVSVPHYAPNLGSMEKQIHRGAAQDMLQVPAWPARSATSLKRSSSAPLLASSTMENANELQNQLRMAAGVLVAQHSGADVSTVNPAVRSLDALSADGATANGVASASTHMPGSDGQLSLSPAPADRDQHEHLRQRRPRANEHGHVDRRLKRDRDNRGEEGRHKFQRADEEPHGHAHHGRANSVQYSRTKTQGQHPSSGRRHGPSHERRLERPQAARNGEPPREHPAAREADAKGSHQQRDGRGHVPQPMPRPDSRAPHRVPPRQGSQPRHRSTSASHGGRSPSRPRSPARVILRTDRDHSVAAATAVKPYTSRRPLNMQISKRPALDNVQAHTIAPGPPVYSKAPQRHDGYNQQLGSRADERRAGPDSRQKQREESSLHRHDHAPRRGGPQRRPIPEGWLECRESLHADRDVPPHGRGIDRRINGPNPGHASQLHQPDDIAATGRRPARDCYGSQQPRPEALPGHSWEEGPPPHSGRGRPTGLHTSVHHAEERRQALPQRHGGTRSRGQPMSPQPRGEVLTRNSIPHRLQERHITPRQSTVANGSHQRLSPQQHNWAEPRAVPQGVHPSPGASRPAPPQQRPYAPQQPAYKQQPEPRADTVNREHGFANAVSQPVNASAGVQQPGSGANHTAGLSSMAAGALAAVQPSVIVSTDLEPSLQAKQQAAAVDPQLKCWYYVDPAGMTQGPCSVAQFHTWILRLCQDPKLLVEYHQFREVSVWMQDMPRRVPLIALLAMHPSAAA